MESTKDTVYSIILERAADLLTSRTWNKGSLFKKKEIGQVCMCVHGAVRVAAEPRRFTTKQTFIKEIEKDMSRAHGACFENLFSSKRILQGYANLHYLMMMAGLTTAFNDNKKTTLRMVKAKLRKTAQLARELGI